jgi:AcrR family transcriptional regulator
MALMVDTVNMRPYHHGNLREALVDAGLELARQGGPDAVVLRAATREAGVSHNAAYRHFADRDQLLRVICERCMRELALLMEHRMAEVREPDPVAGAQERLAATGRAYVDFAVSEPGWFRTAFAVPATVAHFGPGEGAGDSGRNPYELLSDCLDDLHRAGALTAERRANAEVAAWSAVHGLAALLTEGPLRGLPDADREAALATVLRVVADGLMG